MSAQSTLTPIKAIRAKCLDCSGNYYKSVRECPVTKCPLFPYRMGKRPQGNNSPCEEVSTENDEIAPTFFTSEGIQEGVSYGIEE